MWTRVRPWKAALAAEDDAIDLSRESTYAGAFALMQLIVISEVGRCMLTPS
jgi:hypothetical protein